MSASPTAVFQLTSVMESCGRGSSNASGVTGGPTLFRHRASDSSSRWTTGANQATATDVSGARSSAVLRAAREVPATHPCEAPMTTNRKKKGYRLQPDRLERQDFIKVVPLECL